MCLDRRPPQKLIVCDTMNLWINNSLDALMQTLGEVDILILNDGEARLLTGEDNLIRAGKQILTYGPDRVVIKKGEHGAITLTDSTFFAAPAYPLESVSDPTGAGDSFAGGFLGLSCFCWGDLRGSDPQSDYLRNSGCFLQC